MWSGAEASAVSPLPAVECRQVSKVFHQRNGQKMTVFSEIDLTIEDGEFIVLLGPSGCGKSTLLSMIAGFEQTSTGKILVRGNELKGASPERGVVFQNESALFPWLTVEENVEYGMKVRGVAKKDRDPVVDYWLSRVGLDIHRKKFISELSGGMKQRVQIARVLANDPDILLMDEPFAALDAQTRKNLQMEVASLWMDMKKTVIFITHDIQEALLLADRVMVMSSGPNAVMKREVKVDLPRPRERLNKEFLDLYHYLTDEIEQQQK